MSTPKMLARSISQRGVAVDSFVIHMINGSNFIAFNNKTRPIFWTRISFYCSILWEIILFSKNFIIFLEFSEENFQSAAAKKGFSMPYFWSHLYWKCNLKLGILEFQLCMFVNLKLSTRNELDCDSSSDLTSISQHWNRIV